MNWLAGGALTLTIMLLAGCMRPASAPPTVPVARYIVGQPYEMGGMWSYPKEAFAGTETGLAMVLLDQRRGRRTSNGEEFDPGLLMAAHRSLQLPAIISVTNLENGRAVRLRVNDRGPPNPTRLLGLSARAALLLGIAPGGAAQIRLAVDTAPSQALAGQLPSTERAELVMTAAPAGLVEREALTPLPGARPSAWLREVGIRGPAVTTVAAAAPALPPNPLPEALTQYPASPGRLMLEAGSFFRRDLAQRQAARIAGLAARVEQRGGGRGATYRVVAGPFGSVAEADAAFAGALGQGLPEARLVVE